MSIRRKPPESPAPSDTPQDGPTRRTGPPAAPSPADADLEAILLTWLDLTCSDEALGGEASSRVGVADGGAADQQVDDDGEEQGGTGHQVSDGGIVPDPATDLAARAEQVATLRARLLAVLEDDSGQSSLPPPTAGGMSQADWDALTEAERNVYRGRQLRRLDPRLMKHSLTNPSGPYDRSPRSLNR